MQIMGLAKLPAYKSITIWISLALIFQVFCFWKTELTISLRNFLDNLFESTTTRRALSSGAKH